MLPTREDNRTLPLMISQYFTGQTLFITGAAGFMGKILVEKILRSCPEVKKIYVLVRGKRNMTSQKRLEDMKNNPIFNKLRSINPDALDKIHSVEGDIIHDHCGLSDKDIQTLIEEVTLVYHMAATISFREDLLDALLNNTKGTYIVTTLVKSFKKLQVFVYVSTAYSNSNLKCEEVAEAVLPAVQDWRVMLKLLDTEPLVLDIMKDKILCGHPNPYTFSKSLAEQIVNEHKEFFPIVLMRPSIVIPCFREPEVYWADTLCGISAITLPITLGFIRGSSTRADYHQDYVPADTATNATIIATAKKLDNRKKGVGSVDVYNCGIGEDKPLTGRSMVNVGRKLVDEYPSKYTIWRMYINFIPNELLRMIFFVLFEVFPAMILDIVLLLTFNKPQVLGLLKKCSRIIKVFKKFSDKTIVFPNDRFQQLENFIPKNEVKMFTVKVDEYSIEDIMKIGYLSNLIHFLKDDISEEAMKKNRRRLFWLKVLDMILVKGTFAISIMYLLIRNYSNILFIFF